MHSDLEDSILIDSVEKMIALRRYTVDLQYNYSHWIIFEAAMVY